jgi:hypothetical protein
MLKVRCLGPWLAVALTLGALVGCGGRTDLAGVTGTVTLDGQPLPDALVIFTPLTGGRPAAGRTDAQGKYELVFDRESQGAMLGEHLVTITTGETLTLEDGSQKTTPEKVPAEYNSKSDVRAVIEDGANVFDWKLESGGEIIEAGALEAADEAAADSAAEGAPEE